MTHEIQAYIDQVSEMEDQDINLAMAALSIASFSHPNRSIDRYANHIEQLKEETGRRFKDLIEAGAEDDAATRLAALKHVLHDTHDYKGDQQNYDNLDNADLIEVIERRKGLPVALAILYITAAEGQGWKVEGINFPAHFLVRIELAGQRLIFDPFSGCKILEAPDLRKLLKKYIGENAELSADYYKPVTKKETLIRLQNNIKLRLIEAGDYRSALKTVKLMRRVDPSEYRLLLDAGVLYARTGEQKKAISLLEDYISKAPDQRDREEVALMVQQLKGNIH